MWAEDNRKGQNPETGHTLRSDSENRAPDPMAGISGAVEAVRTWSLDSSLRAVEVPCLWTPNSRFRVQTASAEPKLL